MAWWNTWLNRQWNNDYRDFCESLESNEYIWQMELVFICIFPRKWGHICGCPSLMTTQKNLWDCVWDSRKRVKSRFLYQDADVIIPLTDKCIAVRSFVCRNYDKVLIETGQFFDNLRVTEDGLVSGVVKVLSRRIIRFRTLAIDLTYHERVSTSTSSFFAHRLAYSSNASMVM